MSSYKAQRPKGDDMLAESEAVGYQAPYQEVEEEDDENRPGCCCTAGWLCIIAYVFGIVSGLIIGLVEKRSYYCVFHACQSIMISSIYLLLAIVFALIDNLVLRPGGLSVSVISLVWFILYLVLMIVCCVFAWIHRKDGDLFQIIGIGRLAEMLADRFFSINNENYRYKKEQEHSDTY